MALRATVLGLTRYAAKGVPGETVQSARLLAGLGMEGDFHARGGERQLSLLSLEDRRWMDSQDEPGLCFGRYKENILFDVAPAPVPGTRLTLGGAVLETGDGGKRCSRQCRLFGRGLACALAGRGLFAKVVRGGVIQTGDYAEVEKTGDNVLTHFDESGNAVMVDVSAKETTVRRAVARGAISVNAGTLAAVREGTAKKWDVLGVARVAGILAVKRTSDLIPLCHPLVFDTCKIDFTVDEKKSRIEAICTVGLSGRTGAEMEALTGVSVALLTVYDMCKAIDKNMVIGDIRLCEKSGGRSGNFVSGVN